MPSVQVNDITIEYETQGNPGGEPVLLIMGLGMQLVSWPESFCEGLLKQGFYLIRFDNRDSGLSTKLAHLGKPNTTLAVLKLMLRMRLKAGYTLEDMAADAVGLLDALHIRKAHIVGVSMGGMIAQIVAGNYPERTLSLTSIMSTSGRRGLPGPTREARKVLFAKPPGGGRIDEVVEHFADTLRVIGSRAHLAPETVLQQRIRASVERCLEPVGTTRQLLAIGASGDRVALLRCIQTPTLVIHGRQDPLVPVACGRDVARLVPHAVMEEIDDMGHDLPDALNPRLTELIGAHFRAASCLQKTNPT
ncbi:MAG TPA: alpha/beta hydrolase [Oxalicibacterium sp.]|nr:alpha/beta hydrolase [Oxalicibacterium sp.]